MRFFDTLSTLRPSAAAAILSGALAAGCSPHQESPPPRQPETSIDSSTIGTVVGQVLEPTAGALVTLAARDGQQLPAPRVKPYMDQEAKTFFPDTLIAYAGLPVAFLSSDDELHNVNVHSVETRSMQFNRSIPPGGSFDHVFTEPGFYDVRCDIHVAMAATIFVAPTPFAQWLGSDGKFVFENVPIGGYTLTMYRGAARTEQPVDVVAGTNELRVGS